MAEKFNSGTKLFPKEPAKHLRGARQISLQGNIIPTKGISPVIKALKGLGVSKK